jgi:hypothetical protein
MDIVSDGSVQGTIMSRRAQVLAADGYWLILINPLMGGEGYLNERKYGRHFELFGGKTAVNIMPHDRSKKLNYMSYCMQENESVWCFRDCILNPVSWIPAALLPPNKLKCHSAVKSGNAAFKLGTFSAISVHQRSEI